MKCSTVAPHANFPPSPLPLLSTPPLQSELHHHDFVRRFGPIMATALVGSPTSAGNSSRASQDRHFFADGCNSGLQLRQPEPVLEALQATRDMCAYCFGAWRARVLFGRGPMGGERGSLLRVEVDLFYVCTGSIAEHPPPHYRCWHILLLGLDPAKFTPSRRFFPLL